jgi:hypothetical protein
MGLTVVFPLIFIRFSTSHPTAGEAPTGQQAEALMGLASEGIPT